MFSRTIQQKTAQRFARLKTLLLAGLLGMAATAVGDYTAEAQMFTVEPEEEVRQIPGTGVFIGIEPYDFQYHGDELAPEEQMNFNEPVYRARIESDFFEAYGGMAWNLAEGDTLTYLNAGATIRGDYRLMIREDFRMIAPLILNTDYTQVSNERGRIKARDFRQSSISVGMGLQMEASLIGPIRVKSSFVPQIGFSVTSFGATGGQRIMMESQNRMYIDHIFGDYGLSLGYDFRHARFDLEEERFQYNSTANSVTIGLTF